jgi:hypothetical protein
MPAAVLEVPPLFISVIGPPASGKSYFITAMTQILRRVTPRFKLRFTDTDPASNGTIHEAERILFLNARPDEPTELPKTQQDGRQHRYAMIDGVRTRFPVPLQFDLSPIQGHPHAKVAHRLRRNIVLYDNAGEDFLPGRTEARSAATRHLARSDMLLVLFDPTQDPRFVEHCSDDPQLSAGLRPGAQQTLVQFSQEAIVRQVAVHVRDYLRLDHDSQIEKPLLVIVPKSDLLKGLLGPVLDEEPFVDPENGGPICMDVACVEQVSRDIRDHFCRLCPEFVATAESLSSIVRYIPVSSLGCSPTLVRRDHEAFYGIRPIDVRPKWVAVPLLYALAKWAPNGLVGSEWPTGARQ